MSSPRYFRLTAFGGAETVTGSNFLLEVDGADPKRILLDCGMLQGERLAEPQNREPFPYDPHSIDALFLSHAHIDHCGRIPQLVRAGFRGKIYSTPPSREIAELLLLDSMGLLEKEARQEGKPPLYDESDVRGAMELWETHEYGESFAVGPATVTFRDAGHILGSAMTEFSYGGKQFVYTGDLGNSPAPFLPDTDPLGQVEFLLMESVYGDRNHEHRDDRQTMLEDVIEETMRRGGTLLVPAFSVERTQELLFEVRNMMAEGRIPLVPVFLDSPLAINVTSVYRKYADHYKRSVTCGACPAGADLFGFPQLRPTRTTEESREIRNCRQPKIIIAGSGMSNGGRIVHHEKYFLPDQKNALLLIGYQAVGTPGRRLQEGAEEVTLLGEKVPVRARVVSVHGYSAHKDGDGLFAFVEQSADSLERVFVALGEPKSSLHLIQRLRDNLGVNASALTTGKPVELPL